MKTEGYIPMHPYVSALVLQEPLINLEQTSMECDAGTVRKANLALGEGL